MIHLTTVNLHLTAIGIPAFAANEVIKYDIYHPTHARHLKLTVTSQTVFSLSRIVWCSYLA